MRRGFCAALMASETMVKTERWRLEEYVTVSRRLD